LLALLTLLALLDLLDLLARGDRHEQEKPPTPHRCGPAGWQFENVRSIEIHDIPKQAFRLLTK
jgi:hypothetical protein